MKCANCGAPNARQAFCEYCGARGGVTADPSPDFPLYAGPMIRRGISFDVAKKIAALHGITVHWTREARGSSLGTARFTQ